MRARQGTVFTFPIIPDCCTAIRPRRGGTPLYWRAELRGSIFEGLKHFVARDALILGAWRRQIEQFIHSAGLNTS